MNQNFKRIETAGYRLAVFSYHDQYAVGIFSPEFSSAEDFQSRLWYSLETRTDPDHEPDSVKEYALADVPDSLASKMPKLDAKARNELINRRCRRAAAGSAMDLAMSLLMKQAERFEEHHAAAVHAALCAAIRQSQPANVRKSGRL